MPKKQVALVLSGGISLGAYIAGAVDELLHALSSTEDAFEIDIITGASAGAASAVMVAYGMIYDNGATKLHDVWVNNIDIVDLLPRTVPVGEPFSLFSVSPLRAAAQQVIVPHPPAFQQEPVSFCADDLIVALTLANTEALPYITRVRIPAAGRTVELLNNIVLVMPRRHDPALYGSYFGGFSGFLDRRFRAYDFRRGAADARHAAVDVLGIDYKARGSDEFYQPEEDPSLRCDLHSYESLDEIASTRHPSMSVRSAFEIALKLRVRAIVERIKPWGPRPIYAKVIENMLIQQLPGLW